MSAAAARAVAANGATGHPLDRYAVVGHPVSHSLSPLIHRAFADETGEAIDYRARLAPLDGFRASIDAFFADGGRGVNVTVPFKVEAARACATLSARARVAGAVNCMTRERDAIAGDNTDGIGLVRDLSRLGRLHDLVLEGSRVLVVGGGGSARGAIGPLLEAGVERLTLVARDPVKARVLAEALDRALGADGAIDVARFEALAPTHDLVINATSSGLHDASLPIAPNVLAAARLAYDLMYAARPTRFLVDAHAAGARATSDGLGMLVEQAAESFAIWRGVRPSTGPVLTTLRAMLDAR